MPERIVEISGPGARQSCAASVSFNAPVFSFLPFFTFFEKMDFINLLGVRVLDRNVTVIHSLLKREALIDVSQKVRMVTAKARAASAVSFHFREIVNERTTHRWK